MDGAGMEREKRGILLLKGDDRMVGEDTVNLLRECDAGVKMGVASIDEVQDYVKNEDLSRLLNQSRRDHEALGQEVDSRLGQYHENGKDPSLMAKGMSWLKSSMKMGWMPSDRSAADLITDGCNMGIKSLNRYLNEYAAADEPSKSVCRRLIGLEEQMTQDLQQYL